MKFNQNTLATRLQKILAKEIGCINLSSEAWNALDTSIIDNRFSHEIFGDRHIVKLATDTYVRPTAPVAPVAIPAAQPTASQATGYVEPKEWALFSQVLANTNANVWLTGHAGCGKDAMVKHYGEVSGKKVYQINCRRDMSPDIFFGRFIIEDHNMKFVPGLIEQAMTDDNGGILFIDEAASMPAEVAIALNRLLEEEDERTFVIDCDGGREVKSKPGFKVILASNTVGRGFQESTAAYAAQSDEMDGSIHSRISATIPMDFNKNLEEIIIKKMFSSNKEATPSNFIKLIDCLRDAFNKGCMSLPFSTRNLISISKHILSGLSLRMAMNLAYINRLTAEEKAIVEENITMVLGPIS